MIISRDSRFTVLKWMIFFINKVIERIPYWLNKIIITNLEDSEEKSDDSYDGSIKGLKVMYDLIWSNL